MPMFVMTSGLRSLRDKVLTHFEETLENIETPFDRVFRAVNTFAAEVRRVSEEDKRTLEEAGLRFNIHALIGGQFPGDKEHKLYLAYPEGNWVEVGPETPFEIIGASGYGKPILERSLNQKDSLLYAFKLGCLSFDSTQICAADVDYPIDVLLYSRGSYRIVEHRYQKEDLREISHWWQERLRKSVQELPSEKIERAFAMLAQPAAKEG